MEKIYVLVHRCHEQCIKLIHATPDGKSGGLGIGLKQGIILKILLERDGLTQRELTRFLQITSSSCGELIAKLEQGGYVRRKANVSDRRTFDVFLTESGRALGEKYRDESREILEEWGGNLTAAEKERLFRLLTKLSAGLDAQIEKNGGRRDAQGI
ncbi:MAG: MarR family transcriptional regulator [Gracilibacteraceae bacterium]|nr:MarR family transcriptional regulator [Gracilibacteraceae bacterium]